MAVLYTGKQRQKRLTLGPMSIKEIAVTGKTSKWKLWSGQEKFRQNKPDEKEKSFLSHYFLVCYPSPWSSADGWTVYL